MNWEEHQAPKIHLKRSLLAECSIDVDDRVKGSLDERPSLAHAFANVSVQELPKCWDTNHAGDVSTLKPCGKGVGIELIEVGNRGAVDKRHEQARRELKRVVHRQHREQSVVLVEPERR